MTEPTNSLSPLSHASALQRGLQRLLTVDRPRFARFWSYYRNPTRPATADRSSQRPYRQAQEWGLPTRLSGDRTDTAGRELVIENDIAWRIDTMVDFLFGKPVLIDSTAADPARRQVITQLLQQVLDHNGGLEFLQQLALVGAVHGHVDVLVKLLAVSADASAPKASQSPAQHTEKTDPPIPRLPAPHATETGVASSPSHDVPDDPSDPGASHKHSLEALVSLARRIRFEVVEPARALPVFDPLDWRQLDAYGQVYTLQSPDPRSPAPARSWLTRLLTSRAFDSTPADVTVIDLITPTGWLRLKDDRVVASGENSLGEIPLAHIQNVAVPFSYAGASDVEPLLPLQDELNTRLSDRAHRITMQSFRMYLGKGIDNFIEQEVSPGRMWMSDNPEAQVIEFGGDAACPSEDAHIKEIREAMDKTSGVSPIAAGAIKGRIGRLTSAAALRVTMMALLARTHRKRATYGRGIARMCELALAWLDAAGLFRTRVDERQIRIRWPDPIPITDFDCSHHAELPDNPAPQRD